MNLKPIAVVALLTVALAGPNRARAQEPVATNDAAINPGATSSAGEHSWRVNPDARGGRNRMANGQHPMRPPPPPPDMEGEREGPSDSARPPSDDIPGGPIERWLEQLKEKHPDEFERMIKLRKDSPEEFRTQIRRRLNEARRKMDERSGREGGARGENEFQLKSEWLAAWRHATTDEERDALRLRLRESVVRFHQKRLEAQERRLDQMAKDLQEMQTRLEQQRDQSDSLIDRRVQEIIQRLDAPKPQP